MSHACLKHAGRMLQGLSCHMKRAVADSTTRYFVSNIQEIEHFARVSIEFTSESLGKRSML